MNDNYSAALVLLPLCVDMDDTLIHKDVLILGIEKLALSKPWLLPWFIAWLCISRAGAKAWLAREIQIDAANLPYRKALMDYLKMQKALGRKLILVSAADERIVKRVASFTKLFDEAYGSDGHTNLKGNAKAIFIQKTVGADFVYAGDSFADLKVWKFAKGAILCGKATMFQSNLTIPVEATFT